MAEADPRMPSTDLVASVSANPGLVLLDMQAFDAWYDNLAAKQPTQADVATKKGRDALRSYAAEVRSEKSAFDKARLGLTKEWRDMTAQANAAGKVIEQRLETLAANARKPLTDWEEAENARVAGCRAAIETFKRAGTISFDDTAEAVRARGMEVWAQEIDPARYGDMAEEATAAKEAALASLRSALTRLEREEAERAELARLRAENDAREARERADREAREQAEREAEAARQAEQRRVEAERMEAERIARVEREAADRAKRQAEADAEAQRQQVQREHDAALAAERHRAEEAERARQAEMDRIAREEAARQAEVERVAAEQRRREASQTHRTKVKASAKAAIITCGADEDTAKKIVLAIQAGEIPNVVIQF